jgi:hypothetical protein
MFFREDAHEQSHFLTRQSREVGWQIVFLASVVRFVLIATFGSAITQFREAILGVVFREDY